jgi:two-component system LytT family sensor kinase
MKTHCEKCGALLPADGRAYICSYNCTFCSSCAAELKESCPNCGGELVWRPRRAAPLAAVQSSDPESSDTEGAWPHRPWLIWAVSFAVWTLVSLAATVSIYELYRSRGYPMTFASILGLELSQILTYAPLTPFVFALAIRFPIQRRNWVRRSFLHLLFAVAFSIAHIILRGITPYAAWDGKLGTFVSGIWNSQAHAFEIKWKIFENLFLSGVVDDITGTYVPIVMVALAVSYYRKFRDRGLHSAKLETQLVKAHLQALKSHLQPHFLFNTMHSISALMLTDVNAADTMMARLSDLLRMSLESSGVQITCLSRELEFVAGYLEIEKIRLAERLNVVLDIAAETLDAQVPSLLLQPLVENAIRHGVSRLSSGGSVWIIASHDGRDLNLRVRDNGPGLDKFANGSPGNGLGLRTTRERLQTLYGSRQSLEVHNLPNCGAEVCVQIPFQIEPHSAMDNSIQRTRTPSDSLAASPKSAPKSINWNASSDLS